jgi:hypothetical protein
MQLLNIGFAILLIKIALCVLPGVLGIFFLVSSEEAKRHMRSTVCNKLFGISNAIPIPAICPLPVHCRHAAAPVQRCCHLVYTSSEVLLRLSLNEAELLGLLN